MTHGYLNTEGLKVPVHILAERRVFGRQERLVSPVDGQGRTWVATGRVDAALFPPLPTETPSHGN